MLKNLESWYKALTTFLAMAIITLSLTSAPVARANTCTPLSVSTLADDGLLVTMNSISTQEKVGSIVITINYTQKNNTSDKKIDEGTFKIFFKDGTAEPQYGFFGTFFPGDSRNRIYSWEFLKSKEVLAISYNAGFFGQTFDLKKLNWVLPGSPCVLTSPSPSPSVSASPTPSSSQPSAADSVTKFASESIDMANTQTDVANLLAESTDRSTIIAEQVRDLIDSASSAAQSRNAAAFPKLDIKFIQDNLNVQNSLRESFEKRKSSLENKVREYEALGATSESFRRLASTAKTLITNIDRGLNRIAGSITLLNSVEGELAKQRALLNAPVATPTPTPSKISSSIKPNKKRVVCVKGNSSLTVIGKNPKCPKGYKKKSNP